jgi:hypothetical protein
MDKKYETAEARVGVKVKSLRVTLASLLLVMLGMLVANAQAAISLSSPANNALYLAPLAAGSCSRA